MTTTPTSAERFQAFLEQIAEAPAVDPVTRLEPHARIGRFEVLELLGRGGFGVVYRARDPDVDREVAIKLLYEVESEARGLRFEEAVMVARVPHPGIVTLHDCGTYRGHPYLVFEHLRGETLRQRLERGPLQLSEALRISIAIAEPLRHAHARSIIHRDLKPENVFMCRDGSIKLLDFGLAHSLAGHDRNPIPRGTPLFSAPEQRPAAAGDARSDVYSAAMILWVCVQGLPPTMAGAYTPIEIPWPKHGRLRALLARALAGDPALRPADAAAWQAELQALSRRKLAALRLPLLVAASIGGIVAAGWWHTRAHSVHPPTAPPRYSVTACAGVTANTEPLSALQGCAELCPEAHCVPAHYVRNADALRACPGGEDSRCIPDAISALQGHFVARECNSSLDKVHGGRCWPKCFLDADPFRWPPRDDCPGSAELCSPCEYPPGVPTGVCDDQCNLQLGSN